MRTRTILRALIPRLLLAAMLALGATALVEHAGPVVTMIVLFVLLVVALYVATLLVSGVLGNWRMRRRFRGAWRGPRWWWPFGRNGRGLGGVREPRRPRPPFFPPRGAAAEPDAVAHEP